jgi:hypothetical protein
MSELTARRFASALAVSGEVLDPRGLATGAVEVAARQRSRRRGAPTPPAPAPSPPSLVSLAMRASSRPLEQRTLPRDPTLLEAARRLARRVHLCWRRDG